MNMPFDLIVVDITMPVLSGQEMLMCLKVAGLEHIPVIVLTANTDLDYKQMHKKFGIKAILIKPVEDSHLLSAVHSVLAHSIQSV